MRWRKMMLGMLAISVLFSTAMLGKNLWQQEKEELKFTYLRKFVSEVRDDEPFYSESEIIRADSTEDNENKRVILPEYQKLAEENPDFSGWISIEGTRIDYPVMQTPDDPEYYIHRNFQKEYSYAGVPFAGSGNMKEGNGDIFLYGHNMRSGSMFADLLNYQNRKYCEEHPVICLDTLWDRQEYEVFAVLNVSADEWSRKDGLFYDYEWNSTVNRPEYLEKLKTFSLYQSSVKVDIQDRLIYLVTCSFHRGNGRIVVVGVKC